MPLTIFVAFAKGHTQPAHEVSSSCRGNPCGCPFAPIDLNGQSKTAWIPAFAGMTRTRGYTSSVGMRLGAVPIIASLSKPGARKGRPYPEFRIFLLIARTV